MRFKFIGYLRSPKVLISMSNLLKDFPADARKAVLIKQAEMKAIKKQGKYSQKHTIIQIVKEWAGIMSTLKQASKKEV